MTRLPLLLAALLVMPSLASAAPAPTKAVPPSVRPDLLVSIRAHAPALFSQPIVSAGVSVKTPQAVPPTFALPSPKIGTMTAAPARR